MRIRAPNQAIMLALIFVPTMSPLSSELVFESDTVRVKAELGDGQKGVIFRFTNAGKQPVTITDVHTSCGCTTTALSKRVYQPGESGEIEALLEIGQRVGLQRKTVSVITEGAETASYQLTLEVDVPRAMEIRPRMLYWRRDEPVKAKQIIIEIIYEKPIHVTGVTDSIEHFDVSLETIVPGRRYAVSALPDSTTESLTATLSFETDLPPEMRKPFRAFLRVQ